MSFVSDTAAPGGLLNQISLAGSKAELALLALKMDERAAGLHAQGQRIELITQEISQVNARLFARAWSLIAPAELRDNSCLLVMGSEGRGEQILKTDQDNALLLRDGMAFDDLPGVTQQFSAALADFGYPPCPGQIMLTNPLWCQPLSDFKETIRQWLYGRSHEGAMHLAIFFDAAAVAGDAALLDDAKAFLDRALGAESIFLARFAAAADQFSEGGHWLKRLTTPRDERRLDLKKLGTFPIVHGVRALSLECGVREPGTAERLQRLAQAEALVPAFAQELVDALHVLMRLRFSHQLQQRAAGHQPDNDIRMGDLTADEREQLSGALACVRRFRLFLKQHFRFDLL